MVHIKNPASVIGLTTHRRSLQNRDYYADPVFRQDCQVSRKTPNMGNAWIHWRRRIVNGFKPRDSSVQV